MSSRIFDNVDWFRTVERLFDCQEYNGTPLADDHDFTTDWLPGQVVTILDNEVLLADDNTAAGAFQGLLYSEISADIDETNRGDTTPVILRGPGTAKVWNAALDDGATYATSGSDVVELVAVSGKLVPRAAETTPTVAHLLKVESDHIVVQLMAPDSNTSA